jgi:hypothetical protein
MRVRTGFVLCLAFALAAACGPSDHGGGSNPGADGGGGACGTEGATSCDGNSFQTCQDGAWQVTEQCPILCDGTAGCVECSPGANYCVEEDVHTCDAEGHAGGVVETCEGGLHCSNGSCANLCAEAEANRSYVGCEYWPVDLDNAIEISPTAPDQLFGCILAGPDFDVRNDLDVCRNGNQRAGLCDIPGNTCPDGYTCEKAPSCVLDAKRSPFAIVVSNPQAFTVEVTLATDGGDVQTMPVEAGELLTIYPKQMGVPDRSIDHSSKGMKAYRLTSDAPIVAYQFNPLDNEKVFSNDGSLLVPRHAFDASYYAMTWRSLQRRNGAQSTHDYNGYVTVVAWTDGTEVSVTPTANVRAGLNGFSSIMAGQTRSFMLDAFEVLNLEAVGNGDLTGTLVRATDEAKPVGVFAGHEAVLIPNKSGDCCADHLEEMMFPTSTWGKEYAIARSESRGMQEADVLRVLAQTDGTQVSFSPAPASGTCPVLDAGEFCTVDIKVDTTVSASEPILVGHYLKSVIRTGIFDAKGSGDPGIALAVPVEQFRSTYTFLVPQDYNKQFISVVAGEGKNVTLDGTDVTDQLAGFGASWAGGRINVNPGPHTLSCTDGCGLEVYGYSDAVSYLFAGGLDLEQIVVE